MAVEMCPGVLARGVRVGVGAGHIPLQERDHLRSDDALFILVLQTLPDPSAHPTPPMNAYLNKTFPTLKDLDSKLDSELAAVRNRQVLIGETVEESQADANTQRLLLRFGALDSTTDRLAQLKTVTEMMEEFGEIKALVLLKHHLDHQQAAADARDVLAAYHTVTTSAPPTLSLDAVVAFGSAVEIFVSSVFVASALHASLSAKLQWQLETVVASARLRYEAQVDACVEETDWVNSEVLSLTSGPLSLALRDLLQLQLLVPDEGYPTPLWAMACLTKPFSTRFVYHFDGKKETNRVDKPEWALQYLENFLETHLARLCQLSEVFQNTRYHHRFFVYELITSFLVPVRAKMKHALVDSLALVDTNPRLLSHLIFEMQSFDARMLATYAFNPHQTMAPSVAGRALQTLQALQAPQALGQSGLAGLARQWSGLTGDTLRNKDYFQQWLDNEKKLAMTRFQDIVEATNAFEIDYDFVDASESKPTVSSVNVQKLFESITSHFQTIRILKYQLKFVSAIQIPLLGFYLDRLREGVQAFKLLFHKSRLSYTEDPEAQKIQGVQGIERLCRLYCSTLFVVKCIEQWLERKLFLELWWQVEPQLPSGSLFDRVIGEYRDLLRDVSGLMAEFLRKEAKRAFKPYLASSQWASMTLHTGKVSAALVTPLRSLGEEMAILSKAVSETDRLPVVGEVAEYLVETFTDYVVGSSNFKSEGAAQLAEDWAAVTSTLSLPKVIERRKFEEVVAVLSVRQEQWVSMGFQDLASMKQSGLYGEDFRVVRKAMGLQLLTNREITQTLARREV